MSPAAIGTVIDLELRQRVRSVAWYVLLGVFAAVMLVVTVLLLLAQNSFGTDGGRVAFSTVVFFVLLLGTLVTPALAGGAVNGDREQGTLATTQVTLVTAGELLVGKVLAAWLAALAFLVVAVPFLLVAVLAGGVRFDTVAVALLVTAVELGVVAALGVGFSAIVPRTIFSVVVTYLVIAALSVGTLIAFGLGGVVAKTTVVRTSEYYADNAYNGSGDLVNPVCAPPEIINGEQPRFDRVWWILSANPYVILADAVPTTWSRDHAPTDLFGGIKYVARQAQVAPHDRVYTSDCHPSRNTEHGISPQRTVETTAPTWAAGLLLQLLLTAAVLLGAFRALRTPTHRLPRGSRVA